MRLTRNLQAAALAVTLASSACQSNAIGNYLKKMQLMEEQATTSHRCETRPAIPGGLGTHSYIVLQIHHDSISGGIGEDGAVSQVFQFHAVGDLIRRYGVRTVILEGFSHTDDSKSAFADRQIPERYRALFQKCVEDARESMVKERPDLIGGHNAEDACLSASFFRGYGSTHHIILAALNPNVSFIGFEMDPDRNDGILNGLKGETARSLESFKRNPRMLRDPSNKRRLSQIVEDMRYIVQGRSEHAVKAAVSRSSHNTAVVIGRGHEDTLIKSIRAIPHRKRPTFHFMGPSCQSMPDFFVSSDIVQIGELSAGEEGK